MFLSFPSLRRLNSLSSCGQPTLPRFDATPRNHGFFHGRIQRQEIENQEKLRRFTVVLPWAFRLSGRSQNQLSNMNDTEGKVQGQAIFVFTGCASHGVGVGVEPSLD